MIKKLYLVQHSHTDIGYTHGQGRLIRWHADFIRQAMEMAEANDDFRWTCETFFPVEAFWRGATDPERRRFVELLRSRRIGLSGNYLNFTELPDAALADALAERAASFGRAHGVPVVAAMQADINGCSLIQARAMAAAGVRLLVTSVHPHHGYVPFGKRHHVFRWSLGEGHELLTIHSDQYHVANELGAAPGGEANYLAGFDDAFERFDDGVMERRLPAYLAEVEKSGWPHDFLVLMVSGLWTDNSPPSLAIVDRLRRWNERHDEVRLELVSLPQLLEVVAPLRESLPVHGGDWPDWWADYVASDPEAVALFRHAQAERRWLRMTGQAWPEARVDTAPLDDRLALFAEHTFGHSASVSQPWNLLAQQLHHRNVGWSAEAADLAEVLIDEAGEALGGGASAYDRAPAFRIVNPTQSTQRALVELEVEGAEAQRWQVYDAPEVVRIASGEVLAHQRLHSMRGLKLAVEVEVAAGEAIDVLLRKGDTPPADAAAVPARVPDGAHDIAGDSADVAPTTLQTDAVEIGWTPGRGITSWVDRESGRELLDLSGEVVGAFSLVASRLILSKQASEQCGRRRRLGRNRNAEEARWSRSQLIRARRSLDGPHLVGVDLDCQMDGMELLRVSLQARRHLRRVDIEVIMHKIGTWDVENVYLALPFTAGHDQQLWLDRGQPMRPGMDQLPGTLVDYYAVQDGIAWCGSEQGIALAQRDSHLIQVGPIGYGVRQLSSGQPLPSGPVYAWLMSNYWETNYSAEIGGFYSFRFSVQWSPELVDPHRAIARCRDVVCPPVRGIRLGRSAQAISAIARSEA